MAASQDSKPFHDCEPLPQPLDHAAALEAFTARLEVWFEQVSQRPAFNSDREALDADICELPFDDWVEEDLEFEPLQQAETLKRF